MTHAYSAAGMRPEHALAERFRTSRLVVPLLAVVVATVFTPSRLPLVRRAT